MGHVVKFSRIRYNFACKVLELTVICLCSELNYWTRRLNNKAFC